MRKYRLFVLIFSLLTVAGKADMQARSNSEITNELDSIVHHGLPAGTDISLYIWDLDGDSAVFAYREDVLNRPASTMKVLTSYTALKKLGTEYMFSTTLSTDAQVDADGTLQGNLYLTGGLDPQLMEGDLKQLVKDISNRGIRRISGKLIADVTIMDSIYWGSGWAWDDTPNSFQPYITPLMVHGGFIGVSVKPGNKGAAPSVTTYPASKYYEIINEARTGVPSLGTASIRRDWLNNRNTIIVSGNVTKAISSELNIYDSDNFTFTLLREYLDEAGISYDGYDWGESPAGAEVLASAGHSLREVMKEALKESVNLNAEAMFLQASRAGKGGRTSFNDAAKFEQNFLGNEIKEVKNYNIADGSGLSMYDYVPASMFISVLRRFYQDPELFDIIYQSLPIAGSDGTLKGRMGTHPTLGRVHAKTGTVTGACTLAGYAKSTDGRNFAFCIMNSSAVRMAPSRRTQDAICTILCR